MGAKRNGLIISSMILLLASVAAALPANAVHRDTRYHRRARVRRVAWNPVLKGSYDSQLRQNEEIDRLQLPRIADDQQLWELERTQELVPIAETQALRVSPAVKPDKRYARPWVTMFLNDMSQAYYKEFRQPLQVNSAVRTIEQQHKLRRSNRNAAPELGENGSSHLAGITVDLAKRGNPSKPPRLSPCPCNPWSKILNAGNGPSTNFVVGSPPLMCRTANAASGEFAVNPSGSAVLSGLVRMEKSCSPP